MTLNVTEDITYQCVILLAIQGDQKSKPLPNYHKNLLNRTKVYHWD